MLHAWRWYSRTKTCIVTYAYIDTRCCTVTQAYNECWKLHQLLRWAFTPFSQSTWFPATFWSLHFTTESTLKYSAVNKHKTLIHKTCLCVALAIFYELQQNRWHSDLLQAGRFWVWVQVGARFSTPIKTGDGAHPACCKMGFWSFPQMKVIQDDVMAHVVSCQPFTTKAQSWAGPPSIYSREIDTMIGFYQYFSFPLLVSFHHCSILIHSSTTNVV